MSKVPLFIVSFIISLIIWVSVSLSYEYYYTLNLPLRVANLGSGVAIAGEIPSEIVIKLKARGWKLAGVLLSGQTEFLLDARKDTGKVAIKVATAVGENRWLTSDIQILEYQPSTINLKLEKQVWKNVPVVPDIDYKLRSGYGISADISTKPETVAVAGAKSIMERLRYIPTVKTNLVGLSIFTTEQVALDYPGNLIVYPSMVTVHIDIQKIVDKDFQDITIQLLNVPSDRQVLLIPDKITIGVAGGVKLLGKLEPTSINVWQEYKNILNDTIGYVIPQVTVPPYLKVVSIKPDKIRYILKKF